jgi:alanine racemase
MVLPMKHILSLMISERLNIRPVWAEINLDHLAHNISEVRRVVRRPTLIMTAVKADGYGHGSQVCAETFLDNGADMLAVATPDEGFQIRDRGIDAPVLCLGYTPNYLHEKTIKKNVMNTIFSHKQGLHLNKIAQKLNTVAKFHIKIDTGMNRLGYQANMETVESIVKLSSLPRLKLDGLFTHFAVSDEANKEYTRKQYKKYMEIVSELEKRGVNIPLKHVSNSAAIIDLPEYNLDLVRPGIMLYGYYPSPEVDRNRVKLKQVMTLHAQISHVKILPADKGVSYGLTFKTTHETKIATIPLGYADGYKRSLSNKGYVEILGKKAPIIGRVCMDQFMVDVTGIPDVDVGEEVILIGYPGGVAPDGEKMALLMDTITHEVTCQITKRVPRIYTRSSEPIIVGEGLS